MQLKVVVLQQRRLQVAGRGEAETHIDGFLGSTPAKDKLAVGHLRPSSQPTRPHWPPIASPPHLRSPEVAAPPACMHSCHGCGTQERTAWGRIRGGRADERSRSGREGQAGRKLTS